MQNLYFIQNMLTFTGITLVELPKPNDYFCINPYYCKNELKRKELAQDILKLFPMLNELTLEELSDNEYNKIMLTTLYDESHNIIEKLKYNKLILIEDGAGDYIKHETENPYYKNKIYLFQPSLCKTNEITDIGYTSLDGAICLSNQLYPEEIAKINEYNIDTPCLFTTPLEEDFGCTQEIVNNILDYIKYEMKINQLIISTHPRDYFDYSQSAIDTYIIPDNMPGQTINRHFFGRKIYLFPSTVVMSSRMSDMVTILNPLKDNMTYYKQMQTVLASDIFLGRNSTILYC